MQTITCYIVEDDLQAQEYAQAILKKSGNINVLGKSGSIVTAMNQIKQLQPNFVVLDVFLEDGTAFDFLGLFDSINFKIIFTTSYAKYAIDAFKFSALDYLLKPYEEKEMITALDKVRKNIYQDDYELQLKTLLQNFSDPKKPKKIILKNAETINVVNTEDILYAKSDNNYTTFKLTGGKEILVSKHLKSFDNELSPYNFFRVHQSYLINLQHISAFNKRNEEVVLYHSYTIPVAQSKKKQLIDYIQKHL